MKLMPITAALRLQWGHGDGAVSCGHRPHSHRKLEADTGSLSGTPDAAGKFEVEVTATIDPQVRELDEGVLGWGNEKLLSTSTERVGSASQRFVIEVSP